MSNLAFTMPRLRALDGEPTHVVVVHEPNGYLAICESNARNAWKLARHYRRAYARAGVDTSIEFCVITPERTHKLRGLFFSKPGMIFAAEVDWR